MEKKKNMTGEIVEGYICIASEKEIREIKRYKENYVYNTPYDALGYFQINENETLRVYKVKGTVIGEGSNESGDRPYFECNRVKIAKILTTKELIDNCNNYHDMFRLISFYPITVREALQIAKKYSGDYYVLKMLVDAMKKDKFEKCDEIIDLFKLAEAEEQIKRNQQAKYEAAVAEQEAREIRLALKGITTR